MPPTVGYPKLQNIIIVDLAVGLRHTDELNIPDLHNAAQTTPVNQTLFRQVNNLHAKLRQETLVIAKADKG